VAPATTSVSSRRSKTAAESARANLIQNYLLKQSCGFQHYLKKACCNYGLDDIYIDWLLVNWSSCSCLGFKFYFISSLQLLYWWHIVYLLFHISTTSNTQSFTSVNGTQIILLCGSGFVLFLFGWWDFVVCKDCSALLLSFLHLFIGGSRVLDQYWGCLVVLQGWIICNLSKFFQQLA